MKFCMCGISYENASLDIRDMTAFSDGKKEKLLKKLEEYDVKQAIILSTCNRSEVFFFCDTDRSDDLKDYIKNVFCELSGSEKIRDLIRYTEGIEALRYFFYVASGLKSQIVGEDQILGQVKEAYQFSRAMGYSGKELNKVAMEAIATAKKIKSGLRISEIPLSVAYIGVKKLLTVTKINEKKVMIIGSGKTARLSLTYVMENTPKKVYICNRSIDKANKLKAEYKDGQCDIDIISFADRYDIISDVDIIISATASPHTVIDGKACKIKDKIFLDLASPRDIDKELAKDNGNIIINLDMVEEEVSQNQKRRAMLSKEGGQLIEEKLEELSRWLMLTQVDDTIGSLHTRCEAIIADSMDYLDRKLELSGHEMQVIKRTLGASLKRLLKEPIDGLKSFQNEEELMRYKYLVNRLFNLKENEDENKNRNKGL